MQERKKNIYLSIFLTMLKIGAFTFGGGYAMIALLENEFVENKKWIGKKDFLDMVAIAESTPGPIAVNSATYLGYRVGGVGGALLGTLGVVLPSFTVIFLISLFFDAFLALPYVGYAFRGIQVCVVYLILTAGVKLFREMEKSVFSVATFLSVIAAMLYTSLSALRFSSVFYILIGGTVGLLLYGVRRLAHKGETEE